MKQMYPDSQERQSYEKLYKFNKIPHSKFQTPKKKKKEVNTRQKGEMLFVNNVSQ